MASIDEGLKELMTERGAWAAAVVDFSSGMTLGAIGSGTFDLDLAAAGNSEVIRAKLKIMERLRLKGSLEDILITLTDQYHLMRLVTNHPGAFVYYVLHREDANLALARRRLQTVTEHFKF